MKKVDGIGMEQTIPDKFNVFWINVLAKSTTEGYNKPPPWIHVCWEETILLWDYLDIMEGINFWGEGYTRTAVAKASLLSWKNRWTHASYVRAFFYYGKICCD